MGSPGRVDTTELSLPTGVIPISKSIETKSQSLGVVPWCPVVRLRSSTAGEGTGGFLQVLT